MAGELGLPRWTIYGGLRRLRLNRLTDLDPATRQSIRYVRRHPSELVHLDIKPLERIPPGAASAWIPAGRPPRRAGNRRGARARVRARLCGHG